jgi:hypothetical protein
MIVTDASAVSFAAGGIPGLIVAGIDGDVVGMRFSYRAIAGFRDIGIDLQIGQLATIIDSGQVVNKGGTQPEGKIAQTKSIMR